jgi:hypothetical protein
LWQKLENNTLHLTKLKALPGVNTPLTFALVGDEVEFIIEQKAFKYGLSRVHFGISSNKWRICHRPVDVDVPFVVDIVKCCCVLHNFVREWDGYNVEDTLTTAKTDLELSMSFSFHLHVFKYSTRHSSQSRCFLVFIFVIICSGVP